MFPIFQDILLLIVRYKCTESCAEDEMLQDRAAYHSFYLEVDRIRVDRTKSEFNSGIHD